MKPVEGAKPIAGRFRVLVIFGSIPLYGHERGNIQVFHALKEAGIAASFITNRDWGNKAIQPELDRLGLVWTTAPFGPRIGRGLGMRGWLQVIWGVVQTSAALAREIWHFRPTHLYVGNLAFVLYTAPILFLSRLPLIYRIGDPPPDGHIVHRLFWRLLMWRISKLVCISDFTAAQCRRTGFPEMKIRRIYSCAPGGPSRATGEIASRVRLEFQNAVEGGFRGESLWVERQPGVFTAVYCGQLAERKGVHLIVQAARRLLMEGKKLRVLLAGDYSYRNDFAQDLVARVAKDGLTDSICFLGFVRNPRDLLTVCDLHLCPSLWNEPLGNTVLEAKEAAIPSIIFPVGGLAETVSHGVDGWVCKSPTPEDLEEALRFYLEQPEQCRQQGMEARKNLELRFGSERFRKEWTEVFQTTAPTHKIRGRMVISPSNA